MCAEDAILLNKERAGLRNRLNRETGGSRAKNYDRSGRDKCRDARIAQGRKKKVMFASSHGLIMRLQKQLSRHGSLHLRDEMLRNRDNGKKANGLITLDEFLGREM
jgi:hypothetical protein